LKANEMKEILDELPALPFAILADEMAALRRFHETCEDSQPYDVPAPMMQRLAEIGLVRRCTAALYTFTTFGLSVINGNFADMDSSLSAVNRQMTTDGARCPGQEWEPFGLQPQCMDCARQQTEDDGSSAWIEAPTGDPCPQRLSPNGTKASSQPEPVPCVLCTSPDYCAAHGCRQRPSDDEPQRNADFEAGWRTAANWMNRDDLIADIGSSAYLDDRAKALAASGMQEVPRG
jgi:hypothetical protein